MSQTETPQNLRGFSRTDASRAFIIVPMLGAVGAGYWFLLPVIQSLIIPSAPGGREGPWVVRPILAAHFGATAVLAAVTLPLITGPLRALWKREDAALGTQFDPYRDQPVKHGAMVVKGLLLAIYASGLVFYLFSWTKIGPDGIEQHLPWATLHHAFEDIESLEMIPEGGRSNSMKQDGPWYSVTFPSGRFLTLSTDNEGTSRDELRAMAAFIAKRSRLDWARKREAHGR